MSLGFSWLVPLSLRVIALATMIAQWRPALMRGNYGFAGRRLARGVITAGNELLVLGGVDGAAERIELVARQPLLEHGKQRPLLEPDVGVEQSAQLSGAFAVS